MVNFLTEIDMMQGFSWQILDVERILLIREILLHVPHVSLLKRSCGHLVRSKRPPIWNREALWCKGRNEGSGNMNEHRPQASAYLQKGCRCPVHVDFWIHRILRQPDLSPTDVAWKFSDKEFYSNRNTLDLQCIKPFFEWDMEELAVFFQGTF